MKLLIFGYSFSQKLRDIFVCFPTCYSPEIELKLHLVLNNMITNLIKFSIYTREYDIELHWWDEY